MLPHAPTGVTMFHINFVVFDTLRFNVNIGRLISKIAKRVKG